MSIGNLRLRDLFVAGEFAEVNRNEEPLRLGINITDIDTTLVGEQDPVSLENIKFFLISDQEHFLNEFHFAIVQCAAVSLV